MSKEKQYTVEVEGTYHLFAESQEQANNYVEAIHNLLNYQDIDTAPEEYFDYIAREIIPSIPERLLANRELLAKL